MSKYYDLSDKVIFDGDTAIDRDVNDVNESTDAGFAMVEADILGLVGTVKTWATKAKEWAIATYQVDPGYESSRTYALQAKDSATGAKDSLDQLKADGLMIEQSVANCAHAAVDASNEAARWAHNPEDQAVMPGEYSAYHWAQKSITAQRTPGPAGPPGAQGPAGPQGLAGPIGPVGPQGPQGGIGPIGLTGAKGDVGATGPQGVVGPIGPTGPTGPIGPQGPVGVGVQMKGTDTYANIIAKTGARGDLWVVSTDSPPDALANDCLVSDGVGTGVAHWTNVGDMSGPQGPVGPQGVIGPVGPAGPIGPVGPTGPIGPLGPDGPQGPLGPQGAVGPAGPQGNLGPIGPAGPAGPQGPTGNPVVVDGLLPIVVHGPQSTRTISIQPQYLLPDGGTTDQMLAKSGDNDQEVVWKDAPRGKLTWKTTAVDVIANPDEGFFVDTRSRVVRISLPPQPKIGEEVGIADYFSSFNAFNCVLVRNGNPIMGRSEDLILERNYRSLTLTFADAVRGWVITKLVGDLDQGAQGAIPGQIIMWPLDAPPPGYLMCDGSTYNFNDYPVLGALFGSSAGNTFNVPDIDLFPKNSKGINTLQKEAANVGTHGHTANPVPDHSHNLTMNTVGNHSHSCGSGGNHSHTLGRPMFQSGGSFTDWGFDNVSNRMGWTGTQAAGNHSHSIGAGGAHTPTGSAAAGGGHTPVVNDHMGTNQPACTLVNFIIKT